MRLIEEKVMNEIDCKIIPIFTNENKKYKDINPLKQSVAKFGLNIRI